MNSSGIGMTALKTATRLRVCAYGWLATSGGLQTPTSICGDPERSTGREQGCLLPAGQRPLPSRGLPDYSRFHLLFSSTSARAATAVAGRLRTFFPYAGAPTFVDRRDSQLPDSTIAVRAEVRRPHSGLDGLIGVPATASNWAASRAHSPASSGQASMSAKRGMDINRSATP